MTNNTATLDTLFTDNDDKIIRDHGVFNVCYVPNDIYRKHIVKCVKSHEQLVGALIQINECIVLPPNFKTMVEQALKSAGEI